MSSEYSVRPDRVRELVSIVVYLLFISGFAGILFYYRPNLFIVFLLLVFIALLAVMITGIIKKLLRNETLYQFDETGITDYTKPEHVIHLDWSEVAKVEILTNYSSLQIGILGSRVIEEKKQVSENIRENLMRNGNMVFYNIIIDGFLFRKKTFKEMFKRIEELALCYNQNILISEYVDPLERKKRSV